MHRVFACSTGVERSRGGLKEGEGKTDGNWHRGEGTGEGLSVALQTWSVIGERNNT